MTEVEVLRLWKRYRFLSQVRVLAPGPDNRVISGPVGKITLYEEFLHTGLKLPFHPFIWNILDFYQIVPAQLAPNYF